jgi:hypothetical protein
MAAGRRSGQHRCWRVTGLAMLVVLCAGGGPAGGLLLVGVDGSADQVRAATRCGGPRVLRGVRRRPGPARPHVRACCAARSTAAVML